MPLHCYAIDRGLSLPVNSAILQNVSVMCRAAFRASGLDRTCRGHLKHENSAVGQLKYHTMFRHAACQNCMLLSKSASRADFSPKIANQHGEIYPSHPSLGERQVRRNKTAPRYPSKLLEDKCHHFRSLKCSLSTDPDTQKHV
jgi:hypothetical protein